MRGMLAPSPRPSIAERLISVVNASAHGYTVRFPECPSAVPRDLAEIPPTFFLGVARVGATYLASVEIRGQDASLL